MTKKYNRMAQEATKIIYKKSYITKSPFQLIQKDLIYRNLYKKNTIIKL